MNQVVSLTSKELVRRVFSGAELPRLPFIPLVYSYAAELEQVPVRRILTDPSTLARSLQNAQRLFGYDAIVCGFDSTLEAEACGCALAWQSDNQLPTIVPGSIAATNIYSINVSDLDKRCRLPIVLEAMRRLKIVVGQTVALVAVITGPVFLASQLLGRDMTQELDQNPEEAKRILNIAGQVALRVCRAYCELQPDVVAVVDEHVLHLPPEYIALAPPLFQPIGNLVRFYNAHPILMTKVKTDESLEIITNLNMDGAAIGGEANPVEIRRLRDKGLAVGIGIPLSLLVGSINELHSFLTPYMESTGGRKVFLCTEGEVPYETPPEAMHSLIRTIAGFGSSKSG